MEQTYDLTKGNVIKQILPFYFPMLFTNMLQQIYSVVDTTIVGKGLGDNALASVGNMSSLTFLIFGFSMGLTNGFSVTIAQSFGAKNYEKLRKSIASSMILALTAAVILTVLSNLLLRKALVLLQTDPLIIEDSLKYGHVILCGLIATIAYNYCAALLRALGDSKTPLIAIGITTVLNTFLDLFCIFILKTGVEGAAAATVLSQIVSTSVCLIKIRKIDIAHIVKRDFKHNHSMYLELISNGIPMACMNSITAVGCMVIQYFVNGLGVAYTSAYSAYSKYINLGMQPACTAGFTMSSFTSQNYGAKKFDRIRKGVRVCASIAFISYIALGSVMFFFPEKLAAIMLNGDEPIGIFAHYLPRSAAMIFAVDFLFVFRSGCQAMGKSLVPMISGILEMVMRVSVTVIFIGSLGYGAAINAEFSAWTAALILNFTAFEIYLNKENKKYNENSCSINKTEKELINS